MFKFLHKKRHPREALHDVMGNFQLPTFPAVAQQAMVQLRNPKVSASDVAETLAQDPALSSRLLQTVNSPAMGLRCKVDNLAQAVVLMGWGTVESLVLSLVVGKALPRVSGRGHDTIEFWRAAGQRAAAARGLAKKIHPATASMAYTAALLQDMAIPFLAQNVDTYGEVLAEWHNSDQHLAALERTAFPWDHAEVATWICHEWAFPETLAGAIGGHHGTPIEGVEVPVAVVLASHVRPNQEGGVDHLVSVAERDYGLPADTVNEVMAESAQHADEIARLFLG